MKTLQPVLMVLLLVISANIANAATLTYVLQPGSTITPYLGSQPTGPTESLTGTFSWVQVGQSNSFVSFNATALDLSSPSLHLTLDTSPANNVETSVFISTLTSFFDEIIDGTGFYTTSPLDMSSNSPGTYVGPPTSPTELTYSDVRLSPYEGGAFAARLSFTAVPLPEPSTLLVLATAAITLLGQRSKQGRGR